MTDQHQQTLVFDALEDALSGVSMPVEAGDIVAAGRARRSRRSIRTGGLVAVAALAVGVGVGVGPSIDHRPSSGSTGIHIRTIAYTVDSQTDGSVTATWSKQQYFEDHDGLERALRAAGFPVVIRSGEFCTGPDGDGGGLDGSGVGAGVTDVMHASRDDGDGVTFRFDASAMPEGKQLFIGYLTPAQRAASGHVGSIERLVPVGVELSCSTDVPDLG